MLQVSEETVKRSGVASAPLVPRGSKRCARHKNGRDRVQFCERTGQLKAKRVEGKGSSRQVRIGGRWGEQRTGATGMCCGPCCAIDNTSLFLALPAGDTNEGEAAVTRARSTLGVEDCNFHASIPCVSVSCQAGKDKNKGEQKREWPTQTRY